MRSSADPGVNRSARRRSQLVGSSSFHYVSGRGQSSPVRHSLAPMTQ